jgi:hypothetical protein
MPADAVTPILRTGGYYARAWRRYLLDRSPADVPVMRPTAALAGQALLDEIVVAGFRAVRPGREGAELARVEAEAIEAAELYEARGWHEAPERFFAAPPPLTALTTRPVAGRGYAYARVGFDSGYEPHPGEPGRERWLGYAANRRARALMLRHDEPRPWLISVHGAKMGRARIDLRLLRARWLHENLGLNVVLPVLPLHGPRRSGLGRQTDFPGDDVLDNIHGAAQSVWDVRRLVSWIRAEEPAARIGTTGVSLGGHVASLVASLEDGLACAIVGVPAVDLVDLIDYHARLAPDDDRRRVLAAARRASTVVSPLSLTPRVPLEGRFVYAGLADRLVHPRRQVLRLWEHWGRPDIFWYEGSHVGFMRSKPVGRFVEGALIRSGMVHGRDALRD